MTDRRFDYQIDERHEPDVLRRCFESASPWTAQVMLGGGAIVERRPAPSVTLERLPDPCECVTVRACDEITLDQVLTYVLEAVGPLADPLPNPSSGDVVRYREGIHDVALLLFHRRMT